MIELISRYKTKGSYYNNFGIRYTFEGVIDDTPWEAVVTTDGYEIIVNFIIDEENYYASYYANEGWYTNIPGYEEILELIEEETGICIPNC